MNKKLFFPLVAALFTLSFVGCGDTVVEDLEKFPTQNQSIETEAKLTIVVKNGLTGELVKDATVTLVSSGIEGSSISDGTFAFNNVRVGTHSYRVSAEKYAAIVGSATISSDVHETVAIARDRSITVDIYPEVSGLTGTVYYRNKDDVAVPAGSVDVEVHFNGSDLEKKIYAGVKTKADGTFEFKDLPTLSYSLVVVGKTIDGITFNTKDNCTVPSLARGVTVRAALCTIEQSYNTDVFTAVTYTETIPVADRATPVVFKFSSKVDATLLTTETIAYSSTEALEYAWNPAFDELTFKPVNKWNGSTAEGIFYICFDEDQFKSATGKSFTGAPIDDNCFKVTVNKEDLTAEDKEVVATFYRTSWTVKDSIPHSQQSVLLTWPTVEGAESYTVFVRDNSESNFKAAGVTVSGAAIANKDTLIRSVTFPAGADLTSQIQDRTIEFLVQASNTQSKSILNAENAVTVQDKEKPSYTGYNLGVKSGNDSIAGSLTGGKYTSGFYNNGSDYTFATILSHTMPEAAVVNLGCATYFTEDMDVSVKPTATIENALANIVPGITINPAGGAVFADIQANRNSPMAARITGIDVEWQPGNDKGLCFTATIKAWDASMTTTTGTTANLIVKVDGLKDKSPLANPYSLVYKGLLQAPYLSSATPPQTGSYTREKPSTTLDLRILASIPNVTTVTP